MHVVNSQSEVSEGSEEEEDDEEEEESEGEGGREETDAPHFTPFPNRSNITSKLSKHSESFAVTAAWTPLTYALSAHSFPSIYQAVSYCCLTYVVSYCMGSTIL